MGERLAAQAREYVTQVRDHILKERERVERVRLGTPTPGAPALTKEVFEALLDEAQAELKPLNMDQTKTAVLAYINNNYPSIRCGSVKQLNRLLQKFGTLDRARKIAEATPAEPEAVRQDYIAYEKANRAIDATPISFESFFAEWLDCRRGKLDAGEEPDNHGARDYSPYYGG